MGTKIEGDGCYDAALPDEPMFTLLARDPFAPELVRRWANNRREAIAKGTRPADDERQVAEATALADRMRDWRNDNLGKWREAQANGGVQNAERRATLDHIGQRIQLLKARGVHSEITNQLAVIAGDLVAGFHLEGEARHPAETLDVEQPTEAVGQHMAQRQQDEYFCARCRKRWGADEDAPEKCA